MQITQGTISAINGNATITGTGIDWTQVTTNCLFISQGASYQVIAVNLGSSQITISPPWVGNTAAGLSYVIVRDFTPNQQLPLLNPGDLEASAIFTRAMQRLDAIVGQTSSTSNEITITVVSPTTFLVGNFLSYTAAGWALSRTDTASLQLPVGVVTWVAGDGLSFKIKTEGRITGIQGITLTNGNKYYLRSVPTAGGGQLVNITDVTGSAGTILVPVLIADGTNSGFLVNLSSAQGAVFGAGTNGLVPYPGSGINAVTSIAAAGSGYTVNDVLTVSGGTLNSSAAQLKVLTVNGGGGITSVSVQSTGNYATTPANAVAVTGGTGTGATFNLTWATTSGYLGSDGVWRAVALAARTIQAQHIDISNATIDWANILTNGSTLSPIRHLNDLNSRVSLLEGGSSTVTPTVTTDAKIAYNRIVKNWSTDPTGVWSWTVPAGITQAVITLIAVPETPITYVGDFEWPYGIVTTVGGPGIPAGTRLTLYGALPRFSRITMSNLVAGNVLTGNLGDVTGASTATIPSTINGTDTSVYIGSISSANKRGLVNSAGAEVYTGLIDPLVKFSQAGRVDMNNLFGILNPAGPRSGVPAACLGPSQWGLTTKGIVVIEYGNGAVQGVNL
jgi:hypothetical protein